MASIREEAIFNLKAVVQQTGLKPDTLRAWERRYGLPRPERSEGRHRLYSRRDIDTVRWLMARQREGLSISHAVELWGQIEASGQDPLRTEMPLGGRGASGPPPQELEVGLPSL
jgi:DNA-binding transcriptional MerR regulator